MTPNTEPSFLLDGQPRSLSGLPPLMTLLSLLRDQLALPATREGCAEGHCGACTVLLDGLPVCACLVPIGQLAGRAVITSTGLGHEPKFNILRQAIHEVGGVQCGFCTNGILVNAHALLNDEPNPSRERVRQVLAGNLCRCTGYQMIIDGVLLAAERLTETSNDA